MSPTNITLDASEQDINGPTLATTSNGENGTPRPDDSVDTTLGQSQSPEPDSHDILEVQPSGQQMRMIDSKQLEQILKHTKVMEDRVLALEKNYQKYFPNDPFSIPPMPFDFEKPFNPTSGQERIPLESLEKLKLTPEIHRKCGAEYDNDHIGDIKTRKKSAVIDVWVPDDNEVVSGRIAQRATAATSEAVRKQSILETQPAVIPQSSLAPTPPTSAAQKTDVKPKRLRINSKRLLWELLVVTGQPMDMSAKEFLPPFQLFTLYEKQIRDHLSTLESSCSEATAASKDKIEDILSKHQSDINNTEAVSDDKDSGTHLNSVQVLEIMETCAVSRSRASEVFKLNNNYVSLAIQELNAKMTAEEKVRATQLQTHLLIEEWKVLISLLDTNLKSTMDLYASICSGTLQVIAYEDLLHLFNPGDTVIATLYQETQAFIVVSATGGRPMLSVDTTMDHSDSAKLKKAEDGFYQSTNRITSFIVDCFYFDFDGKDYSSCYKKITIPIFDGRKAVTSLPVYPQKFHGNGDGTLSEKLHDRGTKFVELCSATSGSHRRYEGLTLDPTPEEVDSQVIIDFQEASLVHPADRPSEDDWLPELFIKEPTLPNERELLAIRSITCSNPNCTTCVSKTTLLSFDDQQMNRARMKAFAANVDCIETFSDSLRSEFHQYLPSRVFGFILRSRKWARLNINKIEPFQPDRESFSNLVLKDGYRDLIEALVETHFKGPEAMNGNAELRNQVDLIRGKGKGLIILLHGAPGVGKTSTAESVAEFARKPLFPITCGDIGETAKELEQNLDRCFNMAHKWGCVLLLDEADVFLAKRDKIDLKRNALVSVFLRVLEYYAGMLFLTTNRVGTFDDAFKSRIHMTLFYPSLDRESTKQVWKMNINLTKKRFADIKMDIKIDDHAILRYAKKQFDTAHKAGYGKWNGRQIRNAFHTAIALAQWDAKKKPEDSESRKPRTPKLHVRQFKQVAQASADFDLYLREAHGGMTEDYRAHHAKERNEFWEDAEDALKIIRAKRDKKKVKAYKEGKTKEPKSGKSDEKTKKKKTKRSKSSSDDSGTSSDEDGEKKKSDKKKGGSSDDDSGSDGDSSSGGDGE